MEPGKLVTYRTVATFNPIEPVGQTLQPGPITNAQAGNVGMLPEVDGITCAGAQTSISSSPQVETGPGPEIPIEEIQSPANPGRTDFRGFKARFSPYSSPRRSTRQPGRRSWPRVRPMPAKTEPAESDDVEPLADSTARQARRVVAAYATDADECRVFLSMLGIGPAKLEA